MDNLGMMARRIGEQWKRRHEAERNRAALDSMNKEPLKIKFRTDTVRRQRAVFCPNCDQISERAGSACIGCGSNLIIGLREFFQMRIIATEEAFEAQSGADEIRLNKQFLTNQLVEVISSDEVDCNKIRSI